MKFTAALSSLLVALPLVLEVAAIPAGKNINNQGFPAPQVLQPAKVTPKGSSSVVPKVNNAAAVPVKGKANNAAASADAAGTSASASASAAGGSLASSSAVAAAATSVAAAASAQDLQTSLTLDPSQIQPGLALDGQAVPTAGQVASLTSTNNFINFCALHPELPLTNGQQILTGSCNPTPMGVIIAKKNMPSGKIISPQNLANVKSNTTITFKIAVANMETGNFVNAQQNFMAAPQQVNAQGLLVAHSHITVNSISSFTDLTPADPTKFAFFKGLNDAAQGGILSADAAGGLPDGFYRACTLNTAANHQPALVAVAQHASLDDCTYFQVSPTGSAAAATGAADPAGVAAATGAGAGAAAAVTDSATAAATGAAAAGAGASGSAAAGAGASGSAATGASASGSAAAAASTNGAAATAAGGKAKGKGVPQRGGRGGNRNGRGRGRGRN